jgi:hypothetical protein
MAVILVPPSEGLLVHGFACVRSSSSWPSTNHDKHHRHYEPSLAVATPASAIRLLQLHSTSKRSSSSIEEREEMEFFKAGLLANKEEEAALLASKKIRSLSNLGFTKSTSSTKNQEQRRRSSSIRPKYWAWGGAEERAIQDKPNYDPISNSNCPDPWVSLSDFYALVNDDTAVADTIFVALAGGRAFIERDVADQVLQQWYGSNDGGNTRRTRTALDKDAFIQTVRRGQQDFLWGWGSFWSIIGLAVLGIVWPTNPLQMALVQNLDVVLGTKP